MHLWGLPFFVEMKQSRENFDKIYYHATRNTMLAAGLAAMGVPFHSEPFEKTLIKGNEIVIWRFCENTKCMKYSTSDLINWWHDDNWFDKNYPDHPWALVMSGILTKEYLVEKIKEEPRKVAIKRKSQTWVVYENSDLYKKLTNQL